MKNFILNYLFKYIFIFFFILLLGRLIKSLKADYIWAFSIVCGRILFDVLIYFYKKRDKGSQN